MAAATRHETLRWTALSTARPGPPEIARHCFSTTSFQRLITQLLLVTVAATSMASCSSIRRCYTYHQRSSSVRYREPCLAERADRIVRSLDSSNAARAAVELLASFSPTARR